MRFNVFKNTVLLFVLVTVSCASKVKKETIAFNSDNNIIKQVKEDTTVAVGANQTELYLPLLKGKRVGVVANQTSVIFKEITSSPKANRSTSYVHLVDSLLELKVAIKKVFAPEHGFRGKADAGEQVKDGIDTKTKLPIISLHGKHRKPTQAHLQGLDVMVFDIQDVGVRFYTYISTLHNVMEACAEAGIPVIIFDRPNPNGHYIDGPTLNNKHKSFLGMHPIPLVHGMTIGEYAKMINGKKWLADGLQCDITVIPIKNYSHYIAYSLPIRPSPNLPNDQSIKLYPSLGLFEGTTINAGRGTEFQFQRYGAPFLNPETMSLRYTPIANFGAKYPKHQNTLCYGEDLQDAELSSEMTLKWIIKAYENSMDKSKFFNTDNFTKHAGTTILQQQIVAGLSEEAIKATWKEDLQAFKKIRAQYLIYN
ncbi:exo-beta-N-acetylmuramidase NamZ domain-containing protein [Hyunsoonleella sp. 2307UL5-6]|uniref:exo-beta-N-acetylmuramidase NamZ family protein n=1 Tax=Hyunsoonleella sp. 2307UL5-6 TaxID=3384768 RepID=UPI0039BC8AED